MVDIQNHIATILALAICTIVPLLIGTVITYLRGIETTSPEYTGSVIADSSVAVVVLGVIILLTLPTVEKHTRINNEN